MPNQQLIEYITKSVAQGASKEEIKSALLGAGWQEADVNEGLLAVFPVSAHKSAVGGKSKALIMAVSVLAALLLAGGGFAYWHFVYEPKMGTQQVIQEKQLQQEQSVAQAPKKETIHDILAKVQKLQNVSYELSMRTATSSAALSYAPLTLTYKVWKSGDKEKVEYFSPSGTLVSGVVYNSSTRYEYNAFSKRYLRSPNKYNVGIGESADYILPTFILSQSNSNPTFKVSGEDIIDGMKMTVVTFELELKLGLGQRIPVKAKAWVKNEDGVLARMEMEISLGRSDDVPMTGYTLLETKNVSYDGFPSEVLTSPPLDFQNEIVRDLVVKANDIRFLQYTMQGYNRYLEPKEFSIKVWESPLFTRVNYSEGMRQKKIIVRDDNSYFYFSYLPEGNYRIYPKDSFNDRGMLTRSFAGRLEVSIEDSEIQVVGKEIIDGKNATALEFSDRPSEKDKVWIWDEEGVALKYVRTDEKGVIESYEYKDFQFVDIPDNIFEVTGTAEYR